MLDAQKDADQLLRAGEASEKVAANAAAPRALPDVPEEIKKCLEKRACVKGKGGKVNTKCANADGIVADQHRVIEEHRACAKSLLEWYTKIRTAEAQPATDDGKPKHPQSGEPAKEPAKKKGADWP